MTSVVIKSVDEALGRRSMDEFAARLMSIHPEIDEIVVFGSFARGTYAPGSDLDVFIVLSRSEKSIRDRIADFLPGPFPVGMDLFPCTREEVAARSDSPLLAEVRSSRWRYTRAGPLTRA